MTCAFCINVNVSPCSTLVQHRWSYRTRTNSNGEAASRAGIRHLWSILPQKPFIYKGHCELSDASYVMLGKVIFYY